MAETETADPFTNFSRVLSRADDALQDERRDAQGHLEQLVAAGWKLTDHVDATPAAGPTVEAADLALALGMLKRLLSTADTHNVGLVQSTAGLWYVDCWGGAFLLTEEEADALQRLKAVT